jgi:hypothetical protein
MSTLGAQSALYARLEEVLGPEHAVTLMSHIPTEADLATKADLTALGDRFDARFDGLDLRFDRIDVRLDGIDVRLDGIDVRVDGLGGRLGQVDSRFDRLEAHMVRFDDKLDGFHEALRDQSRTYMFTMTGAMASFAAIIIAAGVLN